MQITLFDSNSAHHHTAADVRTLIADQDCLFWIDFEAPGPDEMQIMAEVFRFHPLAIEDTTNHQQLPKVDEYADHLFVILNPIGMGDDGVRVRELDVFVGDHYIVTVHKKAEPIIGEVFRRLHTNNGTVMQGALSASVLLYMVMDASVDSYFPVLDAIEDTIDEMETEILTRPSADLLETLFQTKRTISTMWRLVWPQRDMLSKLLHHNIAFIDQKSLQYYLRDVSDHLLWIADMINTLRETLTSLFDLYVSSFSNRLNHVVNRLTVLTMGIGVLTVISGFYGMNFEQTWPPFSAPWGVAFVGLLMITLPAVMVAALRWRNYI